MARYLVRILPDGSLRWLSSADPVRLREGVPSLAQDDRLWVVLPAEDVLLMQAPQVARNEAQLRQALPYAIEDRLAAPIETQHVAYTRALEPGQLMLAVVARARLDAVLATLRAHGLVPDVLVPEPLLLPWQPGGASLLVEPGRALLRFAQAGATLLEPESVGAWTGGRLDTVRAWEVAGAQAPDAIGSRQACSDALRVFVERLAEEPELNVLQGDYRVRHRSGRALRNWRWAAGLAGLALLLAFTYAGLEYRQLAHLVDTRAAEMAALYRSLVPGATRVVDAEAQLRSALAVVGQGGGDVAVDLLVASAPALVADARVRLDAVQWRNGVLELQVTAPDIAALDGLRGRLAGVARTELANAIRGSQGVEGRLRLSRGGR